jgi:diguanylate cyclase (GGDEF)-like protein
MQFTELGRIRLLNIRRRISYPVIGAVLAAGAPIGLLVMRRLVPGSQTSIAHEILGDAATYLYLTISTTLIFALLGWLLGRHVDRLAELSTTDSLTGLANARAFYPRLEHEVARSGRLGSPVSLLLLDLDRLKDLNDQHGHAVGDRALQQIARAIRRELRAIDIGARLSGDEFAVLAVGASTAAGLALAERLRAEIAADTMKEIGVPATVSIGVATFDPARDKTVDAHALRQAVDGALYIAKRGGRNRIALADAPLSDCAREISDADGEFLPVA